MSVSFGTFSNGTQMVAANLLTNLNLGAAYLQGGVVSGDIPSGTIRTVSIFRPNYYSWPVGGFYGVSSGGFNRWTDGPVKFVENTERLELQTYDLPSDDTIWPLIGMACSIDLEESSLVRVLADLQITAHIDDTALGATGYYLPCGRVSLCYRDRATGIVTEVALSRRDLYASGGTYVHHESNRNLMMLETLPAGSYDIFVGYAKTASVSTYNRCISYGTRTMDVRTFRGQ